MCWLFVTLVNVPVDFCVAVFAICDYCYCCAWRCAEFVFDRCVFVRTSHSFFSLILFLGALCCLCIELYP